MKDKSSSTPFLVTATERSTASSRATALLRKCFGPMPAIRTVVARLEVLGIIILLWIVLAGVMLGLDILRVAIQHHRGAP